MAEYIKREAFIEAKRKQYCADCDRRKGMKNGKMRFCYEIGEAPCRACYVDDLLTDVEDFPAADVRSVMRAAWQSWEQDKPPCKWYSCDYCGFHALSRSNYCPHCGAKMDGGDGGG